jgi:hypothetical protein
LQNASILWYLRGLRKLWVQKPGYDDVLLAALQGSDHKWGLESELSLPDRSEGLPVCVNEGEPRLAGFEGLLDTSAVNFVGDKVTERLLANSTATGKSAQPEGWGSGMVVEKVGRVDFLMTNVRQPLVLKSGSSNPDKP